MVEVVCTDALPLGKRQGGREIRSSCGGHGKLLFKSLYAHLGAFSSSLFFSFLNSVVSLFPALLMCVYTQNSEQWNNPIRYNVYYAKREILRWFFVHCCGMNRKGEQTSGGRGGGGREASQKRNEINNQWSRLETKHWACAWESTARKEMMNRIEFKAETTWNADHFSNGKQKLYQVLFADWNVPTNVLICQIPRVWQVINWRTRHDSDPSFREESPTVQQLKTLWNFILK